MQKLTKNKSFCTQMHKFGTRKFKRAETLENGMRRGTPSVHTVQTYVNALLESYFYYEIKRFDIKGKEFLRTLGKVDNMEVDFIAAKADEKMYIQVTESMTNETVRDRELAPLQKIHDNYEKMVLSLDTGLDSSYEGIKSIHVMDWLLEE